MADTAQSTVDSLLGRLSSVLLEEAQLLRGVRGDVRFIKSEMEIMNGFLLDLANVDNPNNQVQAWTRQVRDLATDFHNCINRYVQSLDASPSTTGGLLGCLRQVPHLARTMPTRHRIATQIRELKSRACELGERRLRYGIKAPPPDAKPRTPVVGHGPKEEKEEEERMRALADVAEILEKDTREVIGWLTEELGDGDPRRRRLRVIAITRTQNQEKEYSLARRVFDHPCTSSWFDSKAWIEAVKKTASRRETLQQVLQQLARAAADSNQEPEAGVATASGEEQQLARAAADSKQEPGTGMATASGEEQQLALAAADSKQEPVATASGEEQQLLEKIKDHLRGKRILIVAANDPFGKVRKEIESACLPAAGADAAADDGDDADAAGADEPDAAGADSADDDGVSSPDDADSADDDGVCSPGSAIIVTAGNVKSSEPRESFVPYKSKDYLSHELFRRNARGLAGRVAGRVDKYRRIELILRICSGDFFCTEMILRALYVNPNRTNVVLSNLRNGLQFVRLVKAPKMVEFCYNGLPSHHKKCLQYLSIYPQGFEIRRTSLVRRWAAENLITKRDGMSEADESERCFNALVAWGLVRPVNIGAAGNVKSCKVHPHVLSFVAKEVNASNTGVPPELAHHLLIHSGIQLQKRSKEDANAAEPPNTCWNWSICERLKGSKAPSNSKETLFESLQASSLLGSVKVLDLEGWEGLNKRHLKYICNKISQLTYLSLRKTGVDKLPKEIDKLQCLETLDIRETKVRKLATKYIVLRKLKHLLAGSINSPSEAVSTVLQMPRGIRHMTDLQILSHVEVSNSEEELMDVSELHQLRKLGVVLRGKEAHLRHLLQVITKLNECLCSLSVQMVAEKIHHDLNPEANAIFSPPRSLVSLTISGRISGLPTWISELSRLSKITLRGTCLTDITALHILGRLDNLHCLRLRDKSYMESTLNFIKEEFQSLKFLLVEGSEIHNIQFDDGAAPKLEKITWSSTKMQAPPSGVNDDFETGLGNLISLPCLKEIELSSNWDRSRVRELISEIATHPNHPVVTLSNP